MSKYTNEFKLEVAKYCVERYHGYRDAANFFNIPSVASVRKWARRYKEHGTEGLLRNQKNSYSGEFKQNVIEYMHQNHLSFQETAYHFKLGNHNVVSKWESIYYEEGPEGLYKELNSKGKNMSNKISKKETAKESKEDLIAENQRLRMENAYLKKLQALIQERTKPKQKKK